MTKLKSNMVKAMCQAIENVNIQYKDLLTEEAQKRSAQIIADLLKELEEDDNEFYN